MDKLKNHLSSIVALLATISAIGAGFIKYGELTTTISVMQDSIDDLNARQYVINETVDLTDTNNKINEIENLVALCRTCHTLAESDREFNEKIKYVHLHNVKTRSII